MHKRESWGLRPSDQATLKKSKIISRNLKAVGALLGHYLRHASTRTESLMTELTTEEFLGPPPDIAPKSDVESETVAPNFSKVKVSYLKYF